VFKNEGRGVISFKSAPVYYSRRAAFYRGFSLMVEPLELEARGTICGFKSVADILEFKFTFPCRNFSTRNFAYNRKSAKVRLENRKSAKVRLEAFCLELRAKARGKMRKSKLPIHQLLNNDTIGPPCECT